MIQLLFKSGSGGDFSVQEIRALQKKLRQIEPKLRTEFMREVKSIGKAPQKAIKDSIPNQSPLSGMASPGAKIQWGKTRRGAGGAKSTTIRFRTQAGGKSLTSTLLAVRVNSAATSIADMAGRSGNSIGRGYKNSGRSQVIRRTYSDGAQSVEFTRRATRKSGEAFIQNLNSALGNRASRMAWKAVEKDLPKLSKDVQFVVDKWAIRASKGF